MAATTEELLLELIKQQKLLAAKLASEGFDVEHDETFNSLVEKTNALYAAEKEYNPTSAKAQSGIAVAQGIDESVGDINGALSSLVEPSDVDPVAWMDQAVNAAVEEIHKENEKTIATQITGALSDLSTQNAATIKKQVAEAVENLDISTRRAFLSNARRITNGSISFEENTIYVIARTPSENTLTVYDTETFAPITLSDRHYCIIVGNKGDDVANAVCATVLSYPTLDPQIYIVKNDTLQSTMSWTGTAICSVVKNSPIE